MGVINNRQQVFHYDGNSSTQLTIDDGTSNLFPQISSGGIVWSNSSGEGLFYDFNTISSLGNIAYVNNRRSNINIYNNTVVYSDSDSKQLTLFDGTNTTPIVGAYGLRPRISSGGIIYSDDSINDHLYLYDWNSVIDLGATTDSDSQDVSYSQQINGNMVTWFHNSGVYAENEVMLLDISSGITTQITNGNLQYGQPTQPVVSSEGYVAWKDPGCGGLCDYFLRVYDGSEIAVIPQQVTRYSFGDDFIAYTDGGELYTYDLITKEITQITNDSLYKEYVAVDGNNIAYTAWDGTQADIFMATRTTVVPEPISSILFVAGGSLLAGRRYMKRRKKA